MYKKLQRTGQLERDVDRLVRNDRIAFGSSMVACKDADAMVTGNIRHYAASIEKLKHVCDARKGEPIFGMTMMVFKGRTVLVADTNVEDFPSAERLVEISKSCVRVSNFLVLILRLLFYPIQLLESQFLEIQNMLETL